MLSTGQVVPFRHGKPPKSLARALQPPAREDPMNRQPSSQIGKNKTGGTQMKFGLLVLLNGLFVYAAAQIAHVPTAQVVAQGIQPLLNMATLIQNWVA
jgi:hypothetical protein